MAENVRVLLGPRLMTIEHKTKKNPRRSEGSLANIG